MGKKIVRAGNGVRVRTNLLLRHDGNWYVGKALRRGIQHEIMPKIQTRWVYPTWQHVQLKRGGARHKKARTKWIKIGLGKVWKPILIEQNESHQTIDSRLQARACWWWMIPWNVNCVSKLDESIFCEYQRSKTAERKVLWDVILVWYGIKKRRKLKMNVRTWKT